MVSLRLILSNVEFRSNLDYKERSSLNRFQAQGLRTWLKPCLPGMHKALGLFLASDKSAMVVHACNLSPQEAEAGKSGGKYQLCQRWKFGASLIYVKPCLKTTTKRKCCGEKKKRKGTPVALWSLFRGMGRVGWQKAHFNDCGESCLPVMQLSLSLNYSLEKLTFTPFETKAKKGAQLSDLVVMLQVCHYKVFLPFP